jgi:hypothetical protein
MAAYKRGNQINPVSNKIPTIGTTTAIMPSSAASLTSGQSGIGQMQGSFDRMFGGGEGPSSMGSLESASMRLADAASKRGIAEKSAESEMSAKAAGFTSSDEMSRYNRNKRQESDKEEKEAKYEQKMLADGYVKIGGRWVRKMA